MSGNGQHPEREVMFQCPDGHFFVLSGPIERGLTGACKTCGWPFEIGIDVEGDLALFWEQRMRSVLVVDGGYSIRPTIAEAELFDDVLDRLHRFKKQDYFIALINHSDEIARGFLGHWEVEHANRKVGEVHNDVIDMVQTCFAHPNANLEEYRHASMFRPPNVGMLAMIEGNMHTVGYMVDWSHSLIVSERAEAFVMAQRANLAFDWSWEFFDREWPFGVETREEFEQIAIGEGRSPYCAYCRGEEEGVALRPSRRGPHDQDWRHKDLMRGFEDDVILYCDDSTWAEAVMEVR